MNISRLKALPKQPASHENLKDPGVFKQVLIQPEVAPNGSIQMINWATLKANRGFLPHYHEDMEEIFIMIKGKVEIRVNREREIVSIGDVIRVPEMTEHEMINLEPTDAVYIVVGISRKQGGKTINTTPR